MPIHSHRHHHHHEGDSSDHRRKSKSNLRSLKFCALAFLLLVAAYLLKVSIIISFLGFIAVITAALTKPFRNQFMFFISIISLISMIMVYTLNWVNKYGIELISPDFKSDHPLFLKGLFEGLVIFVSTFIYYLHLKKLHFAFNEDWFRKKSYLRLLKALFPYEFFLISTWVLTFIMHHYFTFRGHYPVKLTLISIAFAFLISALFLYLTFRQTNSNHSSAPDLPKWKARSRPTSFNP